MLPKHTRILTFCMAVSLMAIPVWGVEIVAHRGSSFTAPENTLAAVNLAWQQNSDGVEIDIHLTADGKIVVLHDYDTKRTAGAPGLKVAEATFAQLRELEVGRWKGEKYAGEKIPSLTEVLATIPAGKRLFIEVKTEAQIVPELKRVLEEAKRPAAETVIIGFSHAAMKAAKAALPDLQVYWLAALKQDQATGAWNYTAEQLIQKAREAGVDGLNLSHSPLLTQEFAETILQADLGLYVWTVNDVEAARRYQALGVLGITTDKPDVLRAALQP